MNRNPSDIKFGIIIIIGNSLDNFVDRKPKLSKFQETGNGITICLHTKYTFGTDIGYRLVQKTESTN